MAIVEALQDEGVSKAERAFQLLRSDILDAKLAPLTALTISSLRQRYDLGWTPLREALSRLEGERLVTFSPNRGYRVAGVSRDELLDLQMSRTIIESELLRSSIRQGGEEWEQQVVAAHHGLKLLKPLSFGMPESELARWEQRHGAFHKALLSGGNSVWLKHFEEQISTQLHRHHRNLVFPPSLFSCDDVTPARRKQITSLLAAASNMEHHTELMAASIAREEDRAIELLVEHVGLTLKTYEATQSLIQKSA